MRPSGPTVTSLRSPMPSIAFPPRSHAVTSRNVARDSCGVGNSLARAIGRSSRSPSARAPGRPNSRSWRGLSSLTTNRFPMRSSNTPSPRAFWSASHASSSAGSSSTVRGKTCSRASRALSKTSTVPGTSRSTNTRPVASVSTPSHWELSGVRRPAPASSGWRSRRSNRPGPPTRRSPTRIWWVWSPTARSWRSRPCPAGRSQIPETSRRSRSHTFRTWSSSWDCPRNRASGPPAGSPTCGCAAASS